MDEKKRKLFLFGILLITVIGVAFWYFSSSDSAGESIKASLGVDNSGEINSINKKYSEVKKLEIKAIDREKFGDFVEREIPKKDVEGIRKGKSNPFTEN